MLEHMDSSPIDSKQIRVMTAKDNQLRRVMQYSNSGWPEAVEAELQSYFNRRAEISSAEGCLFLGLRIIVPEAAREAILKTIHQGHQGISRTKSMARSHVWWPGLDSDIEQLVRTCSICQNSQKLPPSAPLNPWPWPSRPWSRLHVDYAGPVNNKMILIVIDAHSKWIEAHPVSAISSAATIEKLRATFATFGLPDSVVSDNASVFTSHEFTQFLSKNGIEQILVSPYHPASNGLAERAVQTVKEGIRKQLVGSLETRLSRFLLTYRVTPHSTTGVSPCELLQGRKLRTQLDLLRPDRAAMVTAKQMAQKDYHDRTARERSFTVGESVKIRDVIQQKWLPATVTEM
jgi:transposase InsO family protein